VTTGVTRLQDVAGLTGSHVIPDRVAASLAEAADWVLSDAKRGASQGRNNAG
jgi:heptosyltransferase-2